MNRLLAIKSIDDILPEYRQTPIGLLLEFHNLNRPVAPYDKAQMLVGMCMDNRKHLHIPDNFAFIIRAGGANLRYSEFIQGLVETAGWHEERAEVHFMHFAPLFEIGNEIDFILSEVKRLRIVYPKIVIAPMFYKVDDNKLYFIDEN